jgi:hypothetical protein
MNITPDDDRTVPIDCEEFRRVLMKKMRVLAAKRCRAMLHARIRRMNDLQDGDYTVSRFAFPKMNIN